MYFIMSAYDFSNKKKTKAGGKKRISRRIGPVVSFLRVKVGVGSDTTVWTWVQGPAL